jgi:hypothetical protein
LQSLKTLYLGQTKITDAGLRSSASSSVGIGVGDFKD